VKDPFTGYPRKEGDDASVPSPVTVCNQSPRISAGRSLIRALTELPIGLSDQEDYYGGHATRQKQGLKTVYADERKTSGNIDI
jgi:hypothetical protein